ncbi:MAG: CAP domain-containing protein [Candidatus Limnocylindrales bacterium]
MPFTVHRLGIAGLIVAIVGLLVPAAAMAADLEPGPVAISQAERAALTAINVKRSDAGLVTLQHDSRIAAIARSRAESMAATDTFSHVQPDGMSVFDLIGDSGIRWYGAGEIIAWNTAQELPSSTSFALDGWMQSAPHKAIVLSTGYNYAAFGLAISPSTGRRYWAGVFLKGPDRTPARSRFGTISRSVLDATFARVTVRWSGWDVRLQVLTSGLRDFQVQKRRDGGAWLNLGVTTNTSMTRKWSRGHRYEVRVRARDRSGNWGAWEMATIRP